MSKIGSDVKRDAHDLESVGGRREEDHLEIYPGPNDRQQTEPFHEQDYLGFSVVIQVFMDTRMSTFSHMSVGQLVVLVREGFAIHGEGRKVLLFMSDSHMYNFVRDQRIGE